VNRTWEETDAVEDKNGNSTETHQAKSTFTPKKKLVTPVIAHAISGRDGRVMDAREVETVLGLLARWALRKARLQSEHATGEAVTDNVSKDSGDEECEN
jgi:hypothetical protein